MMHLLRENPPAARRRPAQARAPLAPPTAVPIISLLAGYSPRRNGEDTHHIQLLAASDAPLPPVLVHRQTMRVIDGMHRLRAALLNGEQTIAAEFFDGDENEAFVEAVLANTTHGLALTLAEREAAAARIIATYPDRSDRWIADITGLAAGTVARVRRLTCPGGDQTSARVGRDGRIRPLNSAEGRRLASLVIAEHPGASLRDIARLAGISPATVRDVRERLRRGDEPVLPSRQRSRQAGATSTSSRLPRRDRREPAPAGAGRNRGRLLHNLRKDPALRYTGSGRALLSWLDARARGPGSWQALVDSVPPHCAYMLAELARCCADEWLEVAAQTEQRVRHQA
jgi:ParB-like chromosome segregation protein Spo0J